MSKVQLNGKRDRSRQKSTKVNAHLESAIKQLEKDRYGYLYEDRRAFNSRLMNMPIASTTEIVK